MRPVDLFELYAHARAVLTCLAYDLDTVVEDGPPARGFDADDMRYEAMRLASALRSLGLAAPVYGAEYGDACGFDGGAEMMSAVATEAWEARVRVLKFTAALRAKGISDERRARLLCSAYVGLAWRLDALGTTIRRCQDALCEARDKASAERQRPVYS